MTSIVITADIEKKRLKFEGDKIALGEKVQVEVIGVEVSPTLRLRMLVGQKTVAMFPLEDTDTWSGNTCVLNLNTVQAEQVRCGYGLFILEDMNIPRLYGCGECELKPWPKERGEDVPYDLGNYPNVIEDFRKEISESFDGQNEIIDSKFTEFGNAIRDFFDTQTKRQEEFENSVNTEVGEKVTRQQLSDEIGERSSADTQLNQKIDGNTGEINSLKTNVSLNKKSIENEVLDRKSAVEKERLRALAVEETNRQNIEKEVLRAKGAEKDIESKIEAEIKNRENLLGQLNSLDEKNIEQDVDISNIRTDVNFLIGDDKNKSARSIAGEEVAKLVNGAPSMYDTLREIAEYIGTDKAGAAAMAASIAQNASAIAEETSRAEEAESVITRNVTSNKKRIEDNKSQISAIESQISEVESNISTIESQIEEKLEGKQDALEEEQMAAVDSGITAEKVEKLDGVEAGAQKNPDLSGYAKTKDIPYALIEVPLADSIRLTDRAVNKVTVDDSVSNITFVFPEKKEGVSRDFFLRLVITGETVPTFSFVETTDESVSFDADTDSWADIDKGVNILMFSDTEE